MDGIDLGIQTCPEDDELPPAPKNAAPPPVPDVILPSPNRAAATRRKTVTPEQAIVSALNQQTALLKSIDFKLLVIVLWILLPLLLIVGLAAFVFLLTMLGVVASRS